MRIAILSDIHDNVWKLDAALTAVREADTLLCCGDLCSPFVVHQLGRGFPRPIHIVFGNNDGDLYRMTANARYYDNIRLHGEIFRGEFDGRRFAMNPAMFQLLTLEGGAAFYDATMRMAETAQPLLGLEWQVVQYETLVKDLEPQLCRICDYLQLEWVANLGDFAARAQVRERATPSTAQLARGLDSSGIGHWRHYRAKLEPVLPKLNPWVERLGYSP